MKKLKAIVLSLFVLFLFGCKNKKDVYEVKSEASMSETEDDLEADTKYIKQHGQEISFYYNEKFYTGKRTEYYKFPDLRNYPKCRKVTLTGIEEMNLNLLKVCNTEELYINDCNISKIQIDDNCNNIKMITINDSVFDNENIFTHFPNLIDIMLRCKIECIPDLSQNKNLRGIWIFSDTYEENKEMYEKIQEKYPDIIVEPMIDGEL